MGGNDGEKAQFLRKTIDKAQFPWEAKNEDKPMRRKRKKTCPKNPHLVRSFFEYFLRLSAVRTLPNYYQRNSVKVPVL